MVEEGTLSNAGNKYSAYIFCGVDMLSKATFLDPKMVRVPVIVRFLQDAVEYWGTFASAKIRPAFFLFYLC